MTISAEIICDSISPKGARITTFLLKYPRFCHAELMTHRVFSRNSSSSRAIPIQKLIDSVHNDLARPLSFRANAKGMQPSGDIEHQLDAHQIWEHAAMKMTEYASELSQLGVAKEIANRLLEPFSHITVVVTATEWSNFFALRCHPMAQAEIKKLADLMKDEFYSHTPSPICWGDWHLPFVTGKERIAPIGAQIKLSAARCARTSYRMHDGTETPLAKDLELYNRLVNAVPMHASALEHQATPINDPQEFKYNIRGWQSHRYELENVK